jgi:hypothetical protein
VLVPHTAAYRQNINCAGTAYRCRDSSVGIATFYGLAKDRVLVGARYSAPDQTGPGANPASYIMGTGSFPGGKAAGAWR